VRGSQVIASQHARLGRLNVNRIALADDALAAEYLRQRERLRRWLEKRPEAAAVVPALRRQVSLPG